MNNLLRKIAVGSIILGMAATALPALAAISAGCRANLSTCTSAELTEYIAELTSTLGGLQTQLGQQTGGGGSYDVPAGFTFTKNLSAGMKDADVVNLKKVLDVEVPSHAAWTGTNYFGSKVKAAVVKFQQKYSIGRATGFVGTLTRTKLNALLSGPVIPPPPAAVSSVSPTANSTGVAIDSNTTATFNVDLDATTVNTTNVKVAAGATDVAGTVTYANKVITFDPTANLSYSTIYTVTLTTGIKKTDGNAALTTDYSWTFTTQAAPSTAAGLTVALSSDTPAVTTIVADTSDVGQALIPYLKLNFSTPDGTTAKVTTLKLKRLGISADSDIPMAYLYDGETKLAELSSLSSGVVTFTNSAGLFTVSGTKTITVKADLYYNTTAGKTIGFGVNAATDVTTDASSVNGSFPVNGNLMTTALVTDLGRLAVTTTTNAATVDPGTNGFEAMRFTLAASNQIMKIYSIKFLQLGSINKSDISNLSLWIGSTQIGSTVANLSTDGTVIFDLTSAPYEIPSGVTRNISLKVDVVGGSTRTIQFSIQRSADIVAKDANYGIYIKPDTGTAATWSVRDSIQTTVNSGNLVVSKRTDSPSGNIALNSTNITLAKYDVKAVGEDVKISELKFRVASTSGTWTDIKNGRLIYDGAQVGTTQSQVTADTTYTIAVSFTVPVGQTKVVEIRADIVNYTSGGGLGADDKFKAILKTGSSNAQRMTSLGTFDFPSADQNGNDLTVSTAALSATKNMSVGDISTVYNVSDVIIGSYLLTAGAAEGVDVSKITFRSASTTGGVSTSTATSALGKALTNLKVYYGTTQLGSTVVPSTADAASTEYSFYPSPALSLSAGQTGVRIDLKANVLASSTSFAWTNGNTAALISAEGTGKVTTNAANFTLGVAGQGITFSGAGTLTGALDSSSPVASIAAMADTGKTMGIWKVSANTIEDLTVSQILAYNSGSATSSRNVKNLKFYCGSDQFGATSDGLIDATIDYAAFTGTCVVPKGSYKLVSLKADIPTYADGAQAGEYPTFYIRVPSSITGVATDPIIARGAGDYALTSASTNTANAVYPYRTSLAVSVASHGTATGRVRKSSDQLADLTLTSSGGVDTLFRAALDGEDEAVTGWVTASGSGIGGSTVSASTTKIDGTYSIRHDASTTISLATTTWAVVNTGTALNAYSKISLWLYSPTTLGTTTARTVFVTNGSSSTAFTGRLASTTSGTLTADKWNYVELDLPSSLTSTTTYIGVALVDQPSSSTVTTLIDGIRAYNDSITVDLGGNTSTSTYQGEPFYLKTTGGTQKAVGYFDWTSASAQKVILVPSSEISVGTGGTTLELITDTTRIMVSDTTAAETLTLSSDLGTASSAGDFRWYDQAVTATSPITWLNGASPVSTSLSY